MNEQQELVPFHDRTIQTRLFEWWAGLEHNKGERARLRRCRAPQEAMMQRGFFRLYEKLGRPEHLDRQRLAGVGGLLAHVRENAETNDLGQLLGNRGSGDNGPVLSESRFRRLLQYDEISALYHPMIRVIRFVDHRLPVSEFSNAMYYWGEQQKERLAFQYYGTLSLAEE